MGNFGAADEVPHFLDCSEGSGQYRAIFTNYHRKSALRRLEGVMCVHQS
jgi:hypothetical protein